MYSKEHLKKFVGDVDWHMIEDIILEYIEPLRNIDNINLKSDPATVKAEVQVRKETYERLKRFLQDMTLLKITIDNPPTTFK